MDTAVSLVDVNINPAGAAGVCAKTVEYSRNNNINRAEPRQRTAVIFVPLLDKEVGIPPDTTWPVVTLSVGMPNSGGMLPVNSSLETDMQSRKKSTVLKPVFLMVAVPLLTVKIRSVETSSYYSLINIYNMFRESSPFVRNT